MNYKKSKSAILTGIVLAVFLIVTGTGATVFSNSVNSDSSYSHSTAVTAKVARNIENSYVNKAYNIKEKRVVKLKRASEKKKAAIIKKRKDAEKEKLRKKKEAEQIKSGKIPATVNGSISAPLSSDYKYNGVVLSKGRGTVRGPSGKETYYNLNMNGVIRIMRSKGFSEAKYPYAVRADGVKTLGGYVMVAANLNLRPRGSLVKTSLGMGIVCDTGGFASRNPTQLDVATAW